MAKLVAHLNARPISTRFHIRVATVRAVHVMREPARINLPAGARRSFTVKLAHLTSSAVDHGEMDGLFGAISVPAPHRRCWTAGTDLGMWWPARMVATASENRLTDY